MQTLAQVDAGDWNLSVRILELVHAGAERADCRLGQRGRWMFI